MIGGNQNNQQDTTPTKSEPTNFKMMCRILVSRYWLLLLSLLLCRPASATSPDSPGSFLYAYETEVWDSTLKSWKPQDWTDVTGESCQPPTKLQAPSGSSFDGEWKIIVATGRDSMGWEYKDSYMQAPTRQRTWLRKVKQESNDQIATRSSSQKRRQSSSTGLLRKHVPSLIRRLQDEYNFKGFGISVYKSLLFRKSCGIAFRLPLTTNIDWWDRRPALPSISSSFCLYYPPTVAIALSSSIRMEFVKYVFMRIHMVFRHVMQLLAYQFLRGLFLIVSLLVYPLVGKFYSLPKLAQPDLIPKPVYQSDIQERLGMTIKYQWSKARGMEWRVSYWHLYLPTLLAYQQAVGSWVPLKWQAYTASLGIDTSGPNPLPPGFSFTGVLSLSGLYFHQKTKLDDDILRPVLISSADYRRIPFANYTSSLSLTPVEDEEPLQLASTASSLAALETSAGFQATPTRPLLVSASPRKSTSSTTSHIPIARGGGELPQQPMEPEKSTPRPRDSHVSHQQEQQPMFGRTPPRTTSCPSSSTISET